MSTLFATVYPLKCTVNLIVTTYYDAADNQTMVIKSRLDLYKPPLSKGEKRGVNPLNEQLIQTDKHRKVLRFLQLIFN
jgi:hypothetical protein